MQTRYTRQWISAKPERAVQIAQLARNKITEDFFAAYLHAASVAGESLEKALRQLRNLVVCSLIERDLRGAADLAEVVATMTCLSEWVIRTHLTEITRQEIALWGQPVQGTQETLLVLGMGKLGGQELNVSSDIDLIFVYSAAGETQANTALGQKSLSHEEFFTRVGKKLIAAIGEITEDGWSFRVDMALRPFGRAGSLVSSFKQLETYFATQGRPWERYAWCKARVLTGHPADKKALQQLIRRFVFSDDLDFNCIADIRSMHAQIRAEVQKIERLHPKRQHNVKLGRGGIREIEFLSQVFQLVRGGRDPDLRHPGTRQTLQVLKEKKLLDAPVVEALAYAYDFLRRLEHRLQYMDDAQTHVLPGDTQDLQHIAQMMGYADSAAFMAAFEAQRDFVAAQFDQVFHVASFDMGPEPAEPLQGIAAQDDVSALTAQLQQRGLQAPELAATHILRFWKSPVLQTCAAKNPPLFDILQAALSMIVQMPPGVHLVTLERFLHFLEAIARTGSYLTLLMEYPPTLSRALRLISASSWAAQYLSRHPVLLDELLNIKRLTAAPDWEEFARACRRSLAATEDSEQQMNILRDMHHAQQFRLLAQDLEGMLSVETLSDHLSALADILIEITLQAVWASFPEVHQSCPNFAVIAYGKLGGKELGYAADLDLVFLYEDSHLEAPIYYARLAQRFITWMTAYTPAGILFDVDLALRPDGASGLMVSSFATFEKYQNTSAWLWEHQALTRARYCAGDARLGARFEKLREVILGKTRDLPALRQAIVEMREKMRQSQRPTPPDCFDLKQDCGGMIDIEFMVQFFILGYAAQNPALTSDIGNIALLKLCGTSGLLSLEDALVCADAYRNYRKLQHQCRLQGDEHGLVTKNRVSSFAHSIQKIWLRVMQAG